MDKVAAVAADPCHCCMVAQKKKSNKKRKKLLNVQNILNVL